MTCYENKFARLWIHKGILFFEYKPGIVLNQSIAKRVVTARLKLQKGKVFPVCCDIRGVVYADKAARDYLAGKGLTRTKAVGFLAKDLPAQVMVRHYRKNSSPGIPIGVFTGKKAALRFLIRQL